MANGTTANPAPAGDPSGGASLTDINSTLKNIVTNLSQLVTALNTATSNVSI